MGKERLHELLNQLAGATTEQARPALAERIKDQIPQRLVPHRGGMDTINIIIHLKVNKPTAAAAVIITVLLCASFFGGRTPIGDNIYHDGKILLEYVLGADVNKASLSTGLSKFYRHLVDQGRDVAYYPDNLDSDHANTIVMHWKLSADKYGVLFSDLRTRVVSAETLIRLQAHMLQRDGK